MLPAPDRVFLEAPYCLNGCHGLRSLSKCVLERSLSSLAEGMIDSFSGWRTVFRIVVRGLSVSSWLARE